MSTKTRKNHIADRPQNKVINLIGRTFERWTVISGPIRRGCNRLWECKCRCGTVKVVYGGHLNSGATKSCGCLNIELTKKANTRHGGSSGKKTTEFNTWCGIVDRCRTEENYFGREIKVCSGWTKYENFLRDMGARPSDKKSIDRKDNDGNYSCGKCDECISNGWPANCQWGNDYDQANNKRNNIRLTLDGVTKTAAQWDRHFGFFYGRSAARKKKGMTDQEALSK